MARHEIIEKLDRFLQDHPMLDEECHVVYLMVEIRKILDHEDTKDYPLLRFYCDWTVHTEKDRITSEMKAMLEEIYEDMKLQIENPMMTRTGSPIMRFAYMENLKSELENFLETRGMNAELLTKNNWLNFVSLLVMVLENQPINHPAGDIVQFSFLPATPRCVRCVAYFKNPINGYDHYKFSNAY